MKTGRGLRWRLAKRLLRGARRRDIYDRDGLLYLRRRYLLGRGGDGSDGRPGTPWALMLHRMVRTDPRCPHDHPWGFATLILWGGYRERLYWRTASDLIESAEGDAMDRCGLVHVGESGMHEAVREMKPGTLAYRPPEHLHRIESLPGGRCYTLVLRFRKRRSWGFVTFREGWLHWREYWNRVTSGVAPWCGDD